MQERLTNYTPETLPCNPKPLPKVSIWEKNEAVYGTFWLGGFVLNAAMWTRERGKVARALITALISMAHQRVPATFCEIFQLKACMILQRITIQDLGRMRRCTLKMCVDVQYLVFKVSIVSHRIGLPCFVLSISKHIGDKSHLQGTTKGFAFACNSYQRVRTEIDICHIKIPFTCARFPWASLTAWLRKPINPPPTPTYPFIAPFPNRATNKPIANVTSPISICMPWSNLVQVAILDETLCCR